MILPKMLYVYKQGFIAPTITTAHLLTEYSVFQIFDQYSLLGSWQDLTYRAFSGSSGPRQNLLRGPAIAGFRGPCNGRADQSSPRNSS